MEELDLKENLEFNFEDSSVDTISTDSINNAPENEITEENSPSSDTIEFKEIEEPCVALTIIGENKLTDTEVLVKRGIKFSIKAFFSTLVLTIMNLFI